MAEDEAEKQAVALGNGEPVEGAPLARVSARLMWGIERAEIEAREGDTVIRTPDGPRELGDILASVEEPYFATQREFERAVRAVVGTGPVPTTEASESDTASNGTSGTETAEE